MKAATKVAKSARTDAEGQLKSFIDKFERADQALIRAVRKARLEVGLECERSRLHEPGAVLQLIAQKELNAFLISTTRGRHAAGIQGIQDLAGLVRVRHHARSLTPSAVCTLQLQHAITLP